MNLEQSIDSSAMSATELILRDLGYTQNDQVAKAFDVFTRVKIAIKLVLRDMDQAQAWHPPSRN